MASYTTLFHLGKPTVGGDADVWGTILNTVIDMLDAALGYWTITGSSSAYVLTTGFSLPSYVNGQRFFVKWNHTNASTSPTLNVDGLGAKNIKKRDGTTNPSASDLVSGRYNEVIYDGTNMVLNDWVASDFQPLDATLTALAALSWSSGNPVVQFTAADTVSLTLTPSVTSVTASNGTGASTAAATVTNTANSAGVTALVVQGDRASPTNFDALYTDYKLSNASGTQITYARWITFAEDVTAASEDGSVTLQLCVAGSLTSKLGFAGSAIYPTSNDGMALGFPTLAFSDLCLASGAVIDFNNGNVTITHSSGLLSASGAIQARVPLSSETSGTLTTASRNKKVACTGNVTIPNSVFTADDFILFDPGTSSRTFTRSSTNMYVNGADSASATLASNQMGTVHFRSATAAVCAGAFS